MTKLRVLLTMLALYGALAALTLLLVALYGSVAAIFLWR